ncbi:hypothetical protein J2Z32_002970 [Paenibacillus turicensis]|uniref:DUF5348 domain-containing protein n=2 Tax=Paenibacillus turicensis TaxID=160487 RepID=A0ABS4FUR2_9BACL|nr:hypothetical protein [Paenibacillus turicensis]
MKMQYDSQLDRWYALDFEPLDLHCGDTFLMEIGEHVISCRIELDSDWYIISNNLRFRLHPSQTYHIKLL